jgi:hypothetical protein
VATLKLKLGVLSGHRRPLLLVIYNLTGRRITTHTYNRPLIGGLSLQATLDFFGEGDLGQVKWLSQKLGCNLLPLQRIKQEAGAAKI